MVAVTLFVNHISVADVISSFKRSPDRITNGELVYVDEQVAMSFNATDEDPYIFYIDLYSQLGMDLNLVFNPDIRPCVEPAVLCTLPRSPSVLAFMHNGTPLGDDRVGKGTTIPYEANLEITAEIDSQQVASVVFTNGETTFLDDTYPYTWTVPAIGCATEPT